MLYILEQVNNKIDDRTCACLDTSELSFESVNENSFKSRVKCGRWPSHMKDILYIFKISFDKAEVIR